MPFEHVIAKSAMRARFAAPFLCLVILAGCDSQPSETRVPNEVVASLVTPLCHEGFCNGDTDPYPNEPGIWISSSVTSETCGGGGSNDTDQDGLRDLCENNLASYFAPLLRYSTNDNTNGEPRWAARRFWLGSESMFCCCTCHRTTSTWAPITPCVPLPVASAQGTQAIQKPSRWKSTLMRLRSTGCCTRLHTPCTPGMAPTCERVEVSTPRA